MITIDTNETHGLALVVESDWHTDKPKYVALDEADQATLAEEAKPNHTYLNQLHYVAGHGLSGMHVVDFGMPRDGWKRWHPE